MKPKTPSERQHALRQRRLKAGHARKEYWATEKEHTKLAATLAELRK